MLHLYLDLVPESVGNTLTLATELFNEYAHDNEDIANFENNFEDIVWERMKACDEMPHIGNIYTAVVVDYMQMCLDAILPDADTSVEEDASVSINGREIYNLSGFKRAYKDYLEEQETLDDEV
ncbi:hypothetical protein ACTXIV_13175 [Psychrobacter celer]|uniref:hypothetical protein n=1 Tax=Psychrobacter celer TaxID=306572 RepID=UPI003FD433EF